MNNSFVFYRSFAEALETLPAEQYKEIMVALSRYALDGEVPEDLSGIASAVFTLIRPQIDANNKRRENGKRGAEYGKQGGRPRNETPDEPQENPKETPKKPQENPKETPNANVNANANVEEKETTPSGVAKKSRFAPPTVDEVSQYCLERGNRVDAQRFCDFYQSKNWMVGKVKMTDWKAAVRTWEQREDRSRGQPAMSKQQRAEQALREVANWV